MLRLEGKEMKKKWIFIALTVMWTAVIYMFSLQSGEQSGDMSGSILETMLAFFMPSVLDNISPDSA